MANLLDGLNKLKQQTQPAPQQEELQRVARARTGKARTGVGPKISSIGEQAAIGTTQDAQRQQSVATQQQQLGLQQQRAQQQRGLQQQEQGIARQGRMAQQEMRISGTDIQEQLDQQRESTLARLSARENQQIEQINAKADQQLRRLESTLRTDRENIFKDAKRALAGLSTDRQLSELERIAQTISLNDKAYVAQLNQAAQEERLQDANEFKNKALEVAFGSDIDALKDQLNFDLDILRDKNALARELGRMDVENLRELQQDAWAREDKTAIINGITQAGGAAYDWGTAEYQPDTGSQSNTQSNFDYYFE